MKSRLTNNTFIFTKGGPVNAASERKPWEKRPDRDAPKGKTYDVDRLTQVRGARDARGCCRHVVRSTTIGPPLSSAFSPRQTHTMASPARFPAWAPIRNGPSARRPASYAGRRRECECLPPPPARS